MKLGELASQDQPYYRIVCPPIFGSGGIEPGTYWTPRWDAIIRMARTIFNYYLQAGRAEKWQCKIYQLDKADWSDAPQEHRWAFKYQPDAGEKILTRAYGRPRVIYDINVDSDDFAELISEPVPEIYDYGKARDSNLTATWNGKEVLIYPRNGVIDIAIKRPEDNWSYEVIKQIRNIDEWEQFASEATPQQNFDKDGWLSYFFLDHNWQKLDDNPETT